jgi:hypothetical protein
VGNGQYRHILEYPDQGVAMASIQKVSSTKFAGRLGQWSFTAQSAPVMVTNQKTGVTLGYFVSAQEFEEFLRVPDLLPQSRFAWEMPADMAEALATPVQSDRRALDTLMDD